MLGDRAWASVSALGEARLAHFRAHAPVSGVLCPAWVAAFKPQGFQGLSREAQFLFWNTVVGQREGVEVRAQYGVNAPPQPQPP